MTHHDWWLVNGPKGMIGITMEFSQEALGCWYQKMLRCLWIRAFLVGARNSSNGQTPLTTMWFFKRSKYTLRKFWFEPGVFYFWLASAFLKNFKLGRVSWKMFHALTLLMFCNWHLWLNIALDQLEIKNLVRRSASYFIFILKHIKDFWKMIYSQVWK